MNIGANLKSVLGCWRFNVSDNTGTLPDGEFCTVQDNRCILDWIFRTIFTFWNIPSPWQFHACSPQVTNVTQEVLFFHRVIISRTRTAVDKPKLVRWSHHFSHWSHVCVPRIGTWRGGSRKRKGRSPLSYCRHPDCRSAAAGSWTVCPLSHCWTCPPLLLDPHPHHCVWTRADVIPQHWQSVLVAHFNPQLRETVGVTQGGSIHNGTKSNQWLMKARRSSRRSERTKSSWILVTTSMRGSSNSAEMSPLRANEPYSSCIELGELETGACIHQPKVVEKNKNKKPKHKNSLLSLFHQAAHTRFTSFEIQNKNFAVEMLMFSWKKLKTNWQR